MNRLPNGGSRKVCVLPRSGGPICSARISRRNRRNKRLLGNALMRSAWIDISANGTRSVPASVPLGTPPERCKILGPQPTEHTLRIKGETMTQAILELVEKSSLKTDVPEFSIGDTVDVHTRILEGEKERIQI